MSLITWNDSYSVGVQEMDAQHQKLVVLINRFYDSIKNGKATSEVEAVLNELLIYVEVHFSSEEEYMRTINFSDLENHKVNHNNFKVRINNYIQKINSINALNISHDLFGFLKNWLINHIMVSDMEYAKQINEEKK